MAKAEEIKKVQLADVDGNLKYMVTDNCMFRNEFLARGQIVVYPKDVVVDHRCIEPMYEEVKKEEDKPTAIYDPYEESFQKARVESARAGLMEN